jgi:hypothetical protein
VRLVIADVDDTVAPAFGSVHRDVAQQLTELISDGVGLFLISGQSITNISRRVVCHLPPGLRHRTLVAHCNGTEVFGFDDDGGLHQPCLWSAVTSAQEKDMRVTLEVVKTVLDELGLSPVPDLSSADRQRPIATVLDDRGVQISVDLVDPASGATDDALRNEVAVKVNSFLEQRGIYSLGARLAGVSGVDCLAFHVHKGLPVEALMRDAELDSDCVTLGSYVGFTGGEVCEVWGDQFSVSQNGADTHLALSVPVGTRVISFRDFPPIDLPAIPGMRVWPGPRYLDAGLADYLQTVPRR